MNLIHGECGGSVQISFRTTDMYGEIVTFTILTCSKCGKDGEYGI